MKLRFTFLFSLIVFASCVSNRYIDIDVLYPGTVQIPQKLTKLHIIEPDLKYIDSDIEINDESYEKKDYFKFFIQAYDSVLMQNLKMSPAFSGIDVQIHTENQWKSFVTTVPDYEKATHGLILVKRLALIDTIKPIADIPEYEYGFVYYSFYSLFYRCKIEFTNLSGNRFFDTYTYSDTLTWSSKSNLAEQARAQIPPISAAISQTGELVGERYARRLAPFWVTEERTLFYSSNRLLRKGYKLYLNNNLLGAIGTWKHLYEAGTPQLASVAAHNIAVLYEMQDDIKSSELWLRNSLSKKWHSQTENYLYQIEDRLKYQQNLDKQLIQK